MVIWHFPGRRGQLAILVATLIVGVVGYVRAGTQTGATWAAITFVVLAVAGWLWTTLERYTDDAGS